jgi:hypothetical protein
MQRNVVWQRDGMMQWDNANDETQHDNAATNRTREHGKKQRRDEARRRRCGERQAEAAEIFFLDY